MEQARQSRRPTSDIAILRGHPLPLGATIQPDGINFAIASRYATAVTLLIFLPDTVEPLLEVPLDAYFQRTGEVWHAFLQGLEPGIQYAYRMDRLPNPQPQVHRFDPHQELLDPYAKALTGGEAWGVPLPRRRPRRHLPLHPPFAWRHDHPHRSPPR